jgi:hypothetical protein
VGCNESGRPEIWVQRFPVPSSEGSKLRISVDGKLMATAVSIGAALKPGITKTLFAVPIRIDDATVDSLRWDARGGRWPGRRA